MLFFFKPKLESWSLQRNSIFTDQNFAKNLVQNAVQHNCTKLSESLKNLCLLFRTDTRTEISNFSGINPWLRWPLNNTEIYLNSVAGPCIKWSEYIPLSLPFLSLINFKTEQHILICYTLTMTEVLWSQMYSLNSVYRFSSQGTE